VCAIGDVRLVPKLPGVGVDLVDHATESDPPKTVWTKFRNYAMPCVVK